MQTVNLITFQSPLGLLSAGATEEGVCMLGYADKPESDAESVFLKNVLKAEIVKGENQHLQKLIFELTEYFNGIRKEFTVPLIMTGTDFQKAVWTQLLKIPYGKTVTYLEQARTLGKPEAIRAVAHANGMNHLAILIPCHRVVGTDGKLIGYAGGLKRKKWLLELEQGRGLVLWAEE